MRFGIAFLLSILFVTCSALAENKQSDLAVWKPLPEISTAWLAHFYDASSVERNGANVKIWFLVDYNYPLDAAGKTIYAGAPGEEFLSMKSQSEYDCNRGVTRVLNQTFYYGHKATGKIVSKYDLHTEWVVLKDATEIKIACGAINHRDYSQDDSDGRIYAIFLCIKQLNQCRLASEGRNTFNGYAPGIVYSTSRECEDNIPKFKKTDSFYYECRSKPDWN